MFLYHLRLLISKFIVIVTFVLVIIVNSSVINKTMLFDPNVCLVVFYIFHVLTFPEIEQQLICTKDTYVYTNPKYEIQYFIGLVFV
ncbi:hypothetical protein Hdeb2414_s0004g00140961 [Helianthus debilis subsp. tardiflorus]